MGTPVENNGELAFCSRCTGDNELVEINNNGTHGSFTFCAPLITPSHVDFSDLDEDFCNGKIRSVMDDDSGITIGTTGVTSCAGHDSIGW